MKEKEIAIIHSAIKMFATKGFTATSIQSIADDCRISKGAFYLHFKSKESLLEAIFQYYFYLKTKEFAKLRDVNLPPRERCLQYLHTEFKDMQNNSAFFLMQIHEQPIPYNLEIQKIIFNMKKTTAEFVYQLLSDTYGKAAIPYLHDLTLIFNGMTDAYLTLIAFGSAKFNWLTLPEFQMNRMDDIVQGLLQRNESPQLTIPIFSYFP